MTGRDSAAGDAQPLDAYDPRFVGVDGGRAPAHERRLVASHGPLPDPSDELLRKLHTLIRSAFYVAVVLIVAVFAAGLHPGSPRLVIGPEAAVRAQVAERPRRICHEDEQPCAWLTVVDGDVQAFSTNGPLREEFGRMGVAWCPSSGYFGANTTGSRFDARGNVISGPAPRGLDRFHLVVDDAGRLVIDFAAIRTGVQAGHADRLVPAAGPDCDEIPFDREADLVLP